MLRIIVIPSGAIAKSRNLIPHNIAIQAQWFEIPPLSSVGRDDNI